MEVSRSDVVHQPSRLMGIGEFSRRSWPSPKALRLYEQLGLLVPADVGEENGYRRYRESQLATARLVAMLRRLDMPLGEIASVIAAPEADAAELVRAYWAGIERRTASQRELARHLSIQLSGRLSADPFRLRRGHRLDPFARHDARALRASRGVLRGLGGGRPRRRGLRRRVPAVLIRRSGRPVSA